ncbi:MAG: cytochrome P450 [Dehalococcoidia bacterium]
MTTVSGFHPLSAEFKQDPYPSYAWLRREQPVYHDEQTGWWALSRYADVSAALRNHSDFSSAQGIGSGRDDSRMLISTDPPDHTLLRSLVSKAFTPRMVADLEPRIQAITNQLLDRALDSDAFDLTQDLAIPLPVTVIAELLGVEPERRADFKRWSDAFIGTGFDESDPEADQALNDRTFAEFGEYFGAMVEARRRARRNDLISALVAAQEDRDALTTEDILMFCLLLLVAGNETTTNLISNAALALMEHPDQMALLRERQSLVPSMIEEALRYDSPVQGLFRTTTHDVVVAGTTIPADQKVLMLYASANRDEAQFPDAGRFDISRTPNNHIAFGYGIHFCLGAPLARLEARVVWETLLRRTKNLRPDPDRPAVRVDNFIIRGLEHYPILFDPA